MQYRANPKKSLERTVSGAVYYRHAIKTDYVRPGDDYIDIMRVHALPLYIEGDIVAISEKIIALCQNRVIYKKDIRLSFWAKFLSRFVNITPAGEAVGNPYKMQIAIMLCGLPRVLFAAVCAGIGKLFKKRGVFYKIVGPEVIGLDGFAADAFDDYLEMGIRIPENPSGVCDEIQRTLGISCMIVDANDLNVEVLGHSSDIALPKETLCELIRDNPAGQANQQTPLILIHQATPDELAAPSEPPESDELAVPSEPAEFAESPELPAPSEPLDEVLQPDEPQPEPAEPAPPIESNR